MIVKQKTKNVTVRVRLTLEQRKKIKGAAERAGLDLSAWLRVTGLKATEADP